MKKKTGLGSNPLEWIGETTQTQQKEDFVKVKDFTKVTFRIPPELAADFENTIREIKKLNRFISKNRLGILAITNFIKDFKDGRIKIDPII